MSINGDIYNFSEENVGMAPNESGVYALYDGNVLIYYGRAQGLGVTIRSRLQDHYFGREGPCTQAATAYKRELTSDPVAREIELLEEHRRLYGRLPRCNERVG